MFSRRAILYKELDNLFREHFGLDTNTCSGLLQNNKSTDTSSSNDDGEDEIDINQVFNQRVSQLLENDQDDIPDEENTEKKILIQREIRIVSNATVQTTVLKTSMQQKSGIIYTDSEKWQKMKRKCLSCQLNR